MSVIIVDYGIGNLFSVKKLLDALGVNNMISNKPDEIINAEKIILPGVGSFKTAMDNLQKYKLIDSLNMAYEKGKPFLGICLGMQLMATMSHEGGKIKGLGWLDAVVEPLEAKKNHRVPHVGWNNINILKPTSLFKSFLADPTFYFSHSYAMKTNNIKGILATCDYGSTFPVAIQVGNLFATQFHPEKSQLNGKILMENFLNWKV